MQGTGDRWRLGRRPALDGVRGIAILLVIGHHAGVPGMTSGGAGGVTVFFVLSGFLITELLLEEHEHTGRVSLGRFYERRARRLLPAFLVTLTVIVAVSPLLGTWWLKPSALPPVLLYYANWVEPSTLSAAVLHTWSLAVEEQFYVVWPLALLVVARHGRRAVLLLASAAAIVSLTVRLDLIVAGAPVPRVYGGTDSVAFALLIGAALAAWQGARPERARPNAVLIAAAAAVAAPAVSWPFERAVLFGPIFATVVGVLLIFVASGQRPPRWLGRPVLAWVGSRSYGLYLIHGPINSLLEHYHLGWPARLAMLAPVSVLLAEASCRWIETPWRNSPKLRDVPDDTRNERARVVVRSRGTLGGA